MAGSVPKQTTFVCLFSTRMRPSSPVLPPPAGGTLISPDLKCFTCYFCSLAGMCGVGDGRSGQLPSPSQQLFKSHLGSGTFSYSEIRTLTACAGLLALKGNIFSSSRLDVLCLSAFINGPQADTQFSVFQTPLERCGLLLLQHETGSM